MRPDTRRILNGIQMFVEILIAIGFFLALVPFVYLWSSGWVVPLTLISFILSIVTRNGTFLFSGLNVLMALLSFIPLLGYIPRLIGILLALINCVILSRPRRYS